MNSTNVGDSDAPPCGQPGVDAVVNDLDAQLQRLLGAGTLYCLVIAAERAGVVHVQAVTNATPKRASGMLRAAAASGFDSLN